MKNKILKVKCFFNFLKHFLLKFIIKLILLNIKFKFPESNTKQIESSINLIEYGY